jgi:hypothetical protein
MLLPTSLKISFAIESYFSKLLASRDDADPFRLYIRVNTCLLRVQMGAIEGCEIAAVDSALERAIMDFLVLATRVVR